MFPNSAYAPKWTLEQIDKMDTHFFYEILELMGEEQEREQEVYLSDVW